MEILKLGILLLLIASTTVGEEESDITTEDVEELPLPPPPPPPDRIETSSGPIAGMEEKSTNGKTFYSFYSIPFAEPPVGSLRFKNPTPAKNWEEVRDCTEKPPICLQYKFLEGNTLAGQEDCLYLNIFTPKPHDHNAKLPVMIFIHGGGFFLGSSNEYPPHVMMNHEIVLVTIQYRLGMLGFLSTEDTEAPGNYGLQDQIMALTWAQNNIHLFGGDTIGITLFGESAGASSVHLQILSPRSVGLFQRAILMSGSALAPFASGGAYLEAAKYTAHMFNCSTDDGSSEIISCLQKVPALDLVPIQQHFNVWYINPFLFAPRVDGDFMPAEPVTLMKNGRHKRVDLMSGVTSHEGALYSIPIYANEAYRAALMLNFAQIAPIALEFSDADIAPMNLSLKIFDHYLHSATIDLHTADNVTEMFSDRYFTIPHDLTSQMHAKSISRWDKKVFTYELSYRGQRSFSDFYGPLNFGKEYVAHGDDLYYFFNGGYFQPMDNEDDLKMRDIMTKLWSNFATYGDPTPDDSLGFKWKAVSKEDHSHLDINLNPTMKEDSRAKNREFWETLPIMQNLLLNPEKVSNLTVIRREEEKVNTDDGQRPSEEGGSPSPELKEEMSTKKQETISKKKDEL